jgi:hypothetical protein
MTYVLQIVSSLVLVKEEAKHEVKILELEEVILLFVHLHKT